MRPCSALHFRQRYGTSRRFTRGPAITPMFGPDRICGVVAAPTASEAESQLRIAISRHGTRTVELRLDYLTNATERAALLRRVARRFLRRGRRVTFVATCRSRRGGGKFGGRADQELAVLAQAVRAGCQWCDVELELAEQLRPGELRRALSPARVLVSAHDFKRMPRDLSGLVRRLERCGGDAVKVAAACRSLADARRLFALAHGRRNMVVVPMGEDALAARILA